MAIELEFVSTFTVTVGDPVTLAHTDLGERKFVPILSGRCEGPKLNAAILPGGGDHQIIRPDGVGVLEARYAIRTDDGADIYVVNTGYRHAPPGVLDRLMAGEDVPPGSYYMRSRPHFETKDERYAWLARTVFVGEGRRTKESVGIDVYAVM